MNTTHPTRLNGSFLFFSAGKKGYRLQNQPDWMRKELHFFNHLRTDTQVQTRLGHYFQILPTAPAGDVVIDGTPEYFAYPMIAKRIRAAFAQKAHAIKIVVVLRDPSERYRCPRVASLVLALPGMSSLNTHLYYLDLPSPRKARECHHTSTVVVSMVALYFRCRSSYTVGANVFKDVACLLKDASKSKT